MENAHTPSPRITWLFNCIGTPESLLYWNGILPRYLKHFPDSQFFTARPPSQPIPHTDKTVLCVGSIKIPLGRRRGSYERQIVLGSPSVLRRVRMQAPDVVVIQEFLSFALYAAIFRWRLSGSKLLLLLESDPIRGIPSRRKPWTRWLRRFIARRMDAFLTNNEAGKRYLIDELGIAPDRITARPYLVSEVRSDARESNSADVLPQELVERAKQRVVFLFVGQLIERKGLSQMFDAMATVDSAALRQSDFWIVGKGEQSELLRQKVDALGLGDSVQFLGPAPHESLAAYYQAADLFVMPTLDDYRALVGFEAVSYGLPLLHSVYDGAASELVIDGKNGKRVDPHDPSDFGAQIGWIIRNADQLPAMGEVSRQLWQDNFTIDQAVQNLIETITHCHQRT